MNSTAPEKPPRLPQEALSDEEIIERVLKGEKELFEIIVRKYNQRLYRICRSFMKDSDEIDDIMQEAYVRAYEHLPSFEKRSRFSTWLTRILINEAIGAARKKGKFAPLDQAGDISHTATPVHEVMNRELKQILEHAIENLPEKYRSVYVMREMEGMSTAETGDSLNISQVNVKVRLNRAKEMLRGTLGRTLAEPELFHFDLARCDRVATRVMLRIGVFPS